jgi:PAS domain-containing protein
MTSHSEGKASRRDDTSASAGEDRRRPDRRLPAERAVLIVDAGGAVQFCGTGAAQLLDSRSEEVLGRPIQSLIPVLPLHDATLGYNVAYARFWSVEGEWRSFGRTAPVEFKIKPAQRQQDDPYAFIVRLRSAAE